ncbi:tunicamycin resistance protein [Paenibacillus sp. PCH8]|uniref:tunicamycin resistance protein n=1 Tax=Paenibacillus sp. PCH8 TaxID=2066524 RepID=UPI000CFA2BD2|nr:tunicamycin resistance protein [Paenibacillus sp. PCH8]PQP80758.1 tunicamycin resistance protein [Paenibacillus sp. PCH8]
MIIMINGAFDSGKTSSAEALQPLIANSMIYDPEEIGYMLRKLLPESCREERERTDDFQDIELWKILTVKTAKEETIYHRLAKRGDEFGGWQYQQTPKCVEAFKNEQFQIRIDTDYLETSEIIELILKMVLSK